jgi:3-oxoacyl-[acyl-carrier-protein] synthase II
MPLMREVLITGVGQVSALGTGAEEFWAGLLRADSRPEPTPDPWAKVDVPLMYQVADSGNDGPDRVSGFAVTAAAEALADAGLEGAHRVAPERLAVVVGTTLGDAAREERPRVGAAPRSEGASVAAAVARQVGARAGAGVIGNACAASGYAVSVAADMIRSGEAYVAVAGGAEGYSRVALACFNRMGAVDPVRCRPFDISRRGTVFGEGAAMLVLESADHARRRSADPAYARLAGSAWSCDAHQLTAPEPEGVQIRRAMAQALREAGVDPAEVGCTIPHGTGTELNDLVESRALLDTLDPDTPAYSLKALIGHTGGAAGAFAVLTAALMLRRGAAPPNAPLDQPDPQCPLILPHEGSWPLRRPTVLVNAYAFGGNNISLVLREPR